MRDFAHLSKLEKTLLSGAEWPVKAPVWLLLQLNRGIAYLHAGLINDELLLAGIAVVPPHGSITIRASVLGEAQLQGYSINVSSLSGVLTSAERNCLDREAAQECAPFRQLPASHSLAERVTRTFCSGAALNLAARLGILQVFAEWLTPMLENASSKSKEATEQNPKSRLRHFLDQMPESEFTELSLGDVARHLCCCERHASRLFHEVCGCSFRRYVSEFRLKKACQMLAQGDYKIIDVALESGHSSLALFNYNFKSRFRMTPTEWRERHLPREERLVTPIQPALT